MKNNQSGSLGWNWFGWTLAHVSVQHCSEKEAAFGSQIACQPSGMETGAKSPFNLWVFALVSPYGDHLPVISDPEHPVNSLNTSDQSNLRQSRLVGRVKISVLINNLSLIERPPFTLTQEATISLALFLSFFFRELCVLFILSPYDWPLTFFIFVPVTNLSDLWPNESESLQSTIYTVKTAGIKCFPLTSDSDKRNIRSVWEYSGITKVRTEKCRKECDDNLMMFNLDSPSHTKILVILLNSKQVLLVNWYHWITWMGKTEWFNSFALFLTY